ncbi:unnamed protein product [marine sediment metagenome]|uniref:Uncharacterized protein n=1 Tax=marine sediment metagenome TaxID=412755 RepID=X1FK39_9ZZZZ
MKNSEENSLKKVEESRINCYAAILICVLIALAVLYWYIAIPLIIAVIVGVIVVSKRHKRLKSENDNFEDISVIK